MLQPPQTLTRRFLNSYFLFGLAELFTFLVASLVLAWHGLFTSAAGLAVVLPLLILLGGSFYVRLQMRINAAIDEQLVRLAQLSDDEPLDLKPLLGVHPVAAGWNRLREALRSARSWDEIEKRLSDSQGAGGSECREVLDHLSDGIVVADEDGRISFCNQSGRSMLTGGTGEECLDQSVRERLMKAFPSQGETIRARFSKPLPSVVAEVRQGEEIADGVVRIVQHADRPRRRGRGFRMDASRCHAAEARGRDAQPIRVQRDP